MRKPTLVVEQGKIMQLLVRGDIYEHVQKNSKPAGYILLPKSYKIVQAIRLKSLLIYQDNCSNRSSILKQLL